MNRIIPILVLVCLWVSGHAETFVNPVRIPTPVDPSTIATGDFNGDGHLDIVWIDATGSSTMGHLLLAQAGGAYKETQAFAFPLRANRPPACVTADVTRDGKLDLICDVADQHNTPNMVVFPGNGDGTLGAPTTTQYTNLFDSATQLTLAGDLNGDGIPDFILVEPYYSPALVLLSDGHGGFGPTKGVPTGQNYSTPVIADINGDGIPDVLWPAGPAVALGKGDGSFSQIIDSFTIAAAAYYPPATCAFHDMDGDGKLDAVCGYTGTSQEFSMLEVLHGKGDGSFDQQPIAQVTYGDHKTNTSGMGTFLHPVQIADVNGDGIPDVLAESGDGLAVIAGTPGLGFATPRHYAEAHSGNAFDVDVPAQRQIVDMDGDGLVDQIAAGPNGIYLSYGHADGTFGSAPAVEVATVTGHIALTDVNGDGVPDILATGDDSNVMLSLGKGDGSFAAPVAISGSSPQNAPAIVVGDFNGDGHADFLYDVYAGKSQLAFGHGDGTFEPAQAILQIPAPSTYTSSAATAVVADVNHDGRSDLVRLAANSQDASYSLVSSLSNGTGTFTTVVTTFPAPAQPNSPFFYTPVSLQLGDFAHRGQLDAAFLLNDSVYVLPGKGDGTWGLQPVVLPIPTHGGTAADSMVNLTTGDLDGDGNLDLAVVAQYSANLYPGYQGEPSCIWVYFGRGDGTFAAPAPAGCFQHSYTQLKIADLNGDGLGDLVLATTSMLNTYVAGIVHSLPGRTFGGEVNYTAGDLFGNFFIADLNGDHRPDLIFGNGNEVSGYGASSATVLLNQPEASVTPVTLTVTPSQNPILLGQSVTFTIAATSSDGGSLTPLLLKFNNDSPIALTPNAQNIATYTTSSLTAGQNYVEASYTGDATHSSAKQFFYEDVFAGFPTIETLVSSLNPSQPGQSVTFTASLTSTYPQYSGPVAGSIAFADNGTVFATVPVGASGTASATTATLDAGPHTIVASFQPATTLFATNSATLTQRVVAATTITASAAPNPSSYGTPVTFTAQVQSAGPAFAAPPTGSVTFTFCRGATVQAKVAAMGVATFTTPVQGATYDQPGSCPFTVMYTGDANYMPSTAGPFDYTVTGAPTTLRLTPHANPAPALLTSYYFPIDLQSNGKPLAGQTITVNLAGQPTVTVTTDANGAALATFGPLHIGSYLVTANLAAQGGYLAASSTPLVEQIFADRTSVTLTGMPATAPQNSPVTLAATVLDIDSGSAFVSGATAANGTVTLLDGTTPIGMLPLRAGGALSAMAALTTSSLAAGTHTITAVFTPATPDIAASQSAPVTITITSQSIDLQLSKSALSLRSEHHGGINANVLSIGGFTGPVDLSCAVPESVSLSCEVGGYLHAGAERIQLAANATSSVPVEIDTDAVLEFKSALAPASGGPAGPDKHTLRGTGGIAFATLLPLCMVGFRRRRRLAGHGLAGLSFMLILSVAAVASLAALSGCGSKYPGHTPPGTYDLTFTATGYGQGSPVPVSVTRHLTLTVSE